MQRALAENQVNRLDPAKLEAAKRSFLFSVMKRFS